MPAGWLTLPLVHAAGQLLARPLDIRGQRVRVSCGRDRRDDGLGVWRGVTHGHGQTLGGAPAASRMAAVEACTALANYLDGVDLGHPRADRLERCQRVADARGLSRRMFFWPLATRLVGTLIRLGGRAYVRCHSPHECRTRRLTAEGSEERAATLHGDGVRQGGCAFFVDRGRGRTKNGAG
jgi:hypothetical protein